MPVETIEELHDVLSDIEEYRPKFEAAYARMYPYTTAQEHNEASRQFDLYQGLYNACFAKLDPAVSPQVERFRRFLWGTGERGVTVASLSEVRQELWFRHSLAREVIWGMTLERAVELLAPPIDNKNGQPAPPAIPKAYLKNPALFDRDKKWYERLSNGESATRISEESKTQ